MIKVTSKTQIILMYIIAATVYFMSYITRINYNTVLVEISAAEGILRSSLSLPLTASFITYGSGQIISGWLGDRFDPFKLISAGLSISALMNILLILFVHPHIMIVFWAINGFAQALIYPPLMKIISYYLSELNYTKACLFVTIGGHTATLLVCLISPILIAVASWKLVFFSSFTCVVIFLVIWQVYSKRVKRKYGKPGEQLVIKTENNRTTCKVSLKTLLISHSLIVIMVAVIMQGILRDGIATWMPAYLSDVFSISNEISILTTVILPVFSIFSAYITISIRNRLCRDELRLSSIIFSVASAAVILLLILRTNILLSVLILAFISSCSHSINFLLICLVPKQFEKYGKFSLVTGMINSCTYIGSAISAYCFAIVSENCGWNSALILWGLISLIGFICCFTVQKKSNI